MRRVPGKNVRALSALFQPVADGIQQAKKQFFEAHANENDNQRPGQEFRCFQIDFGLVQAFPDGTLGQADHLSRNASLPAQP